MMSTLALTSCLESKKPSNIETDIIAPIIPTDKELLNKYDIRQLDLINLSDGYTIKANKLNTYYKKNSKIGYLGLRDLINSLEGYYLKDYLSYEINNDVIEFRYKNDKETYFKIDTINDVIETNYETFFDFTNSNSSISYASHYKVMEEKVIDKAKDIVFNIKDYGFDSIILKDDVLLPISLINILALETNLAHLIYNEDAFYFYDYYLEPDIRLKSNNKRLNGTDIDKEILDEKNRSLYFLLDNFYGLKKSKNIDSFKDLIESNPSIYSKITSTKVEDNNLGMHMLLYDLLDDPHTSIGYKSNYDTIKGLKDVNIRLNRPEGKRGNLINRIYSELLDYYYDMGSRKLVTFLGNTAFFKVDNFLVGSNDEIYNKNGTIKDDAYKYDTFYLFKKAFELISSKPEITNVVLDFSHNLGGVLDAAISTIGFLTNDDIIAPYELTLEGQSAFTRYAIDSDDDGSIEDLDAYTNYNYYLLSSEATFSAGNYFTALCKDMGLAKIIGQKSGGGKCGVSECSLIDGSSFRLSGTYALSGYKDGKAHDIEFGVDVDYFLPYDKFYDYKYINSLIQDGII